MTEIPIPFPQSTEIYLTAISIIVVLVFENQIREFIEHKNGLFLKFVASLLAILSLFFTILLIYALLNILIIWTSPINFILKIGNNYGTVWYIFASLILMIKPLLNNRNNENFNNLWTLKELIVIVTLFIFGVIYNNFFLQSP